MSIYTCYGICRSDTKNITSTICERCKLMVQAGKNKENILKVSTKKVQKQDTKAVKFDDNKPPLDLIPYSALELEAQVLAFGAQKYDAHNWRKGMNWSRLIGAALRHLNAYNAGENIDPESGLGHLGHARCCLAFLIEYQQEQLGTDDRYNKEKS